MSNREDDNFTHELRSFGRKRGRGLSARQQRLMAEVLPRLEINLNSPPVTDARRLFASPCREVWLEIGFGGGEHLLWQAAENTSVGFLGCEPFEDGIVKVISAIDLKGIGNVLLYTDDARNLLRWLPEASIGRVFILFPDPWPKRRHVKRRLFSTATLRLLARVMKPGAELRLATDIGDYARTSLLAVTKCPEFRWLADGPQSWRIRAADWPSTRYEAKALREGRRCYFFRFQRV